MEHTFDYYIKEIDEKLRDGEFYKLESEASKYSIPYVWLKTIDQLDFQKDVDKITQFMKYSMNLKKIIKWEVIKITRPKLYELNKRVLEMSDFLITKGKQRIKKKKRKDELMASLKRIKTELVFEKEPCYDKYCLNKVKKVGNYECQNCSSLYCERGNHQVQCYVCKDYVGNKCCAFQCYRCEKWLCFKDEHSKERGTGLCMPCIIEQKEERLMFEEEDRLFAEVEEEEDLLNKEEEENEQGEEYDSEYEKKESEFRLNYFLELYFKSYRAGPVDSERRGSSYMYIIDAVTHEGVELGYVMINELYNSWYNELVKEEAKGIFQIEGVTKKVFEEVIKFPDSLDKELTDTQWEVIGDFDDHWAIGFDFQDEFSIKDKK